jgi:hypothetical protein
VCVMVSMSESECCMSTSRAISLMTTQILGYLPVAICDFEDVLIVMQRENRV